MEFRYYNANPQNRDTNDCVIRAIALFTFQICNPNMEFDKKVMNEYYDSIYDSLYVLSKRKSLMINDERVYKEFLKSIFTKEIECKNNEIVNDINTNEPTLINLNGHLTYSNNNVLYDTFDCRNEKVDSVIVRRF